MSEGFLKLALGVVDMGLLRDCVREKVAFWKTGIRDCEADECCAGDFDGCCDVVDLEYFLGRFENVLWRVESAMEGVWENGLEYLDQHEMFRVEQRVEVIRLLGERTTRVVFLFHGRHGACFVFENLQELVRSFLDGDDGERRFECEAGAVEFLRYWDLGSF